MKRVLAVITMATLLGGCSMTRLMRDDIQHVGGAPGAIADRTGYYPTAGSKKLYVYRAVVTFALISKVGEVIIGDHQNADAFVQYQKAVADDINQLAGHIYPPESTSCASLSKVCVNYPQLFESDVPKLEEHMLRLGLAALPRERATAFISAVSEGNVVSAGLAAWKLAKISLVAGHNAAAVRRSERELFAVLQCEDPVASIKDAYSDSCLGPNLLGDSEFGLERRHQNVEKAARKIESMNAPAMFEPFYLIIRDTCRQLPRSVDQFRERESLCVKIAWKPIWDRYPAPPPQKAEVVPPAAAAPPPG
jgi:hypothetical protein